MSVSNSEINLLAFHRYRLLKVLQNYYYKMLNVGNVQNCFLHFFIGSALIKKFLLFFNNIGYIRYAVDRRMLSNARVVGIDTVHGQPVTLNLYIPSNNSFSFT